MTAAPTFLTTEDCMVECIALSPIESGHYRIKQHTSFEAESSIQPIDDFSKRWFSLLSVAKQNMPSVLLHTTEIRALLTMLENPFIITTVQDAIKGFGDTRKGFLYFLDSDMCRLLPITARAELFSFVQLFICPQSYYYPDVELLVCRNLSLIEFLMIGHCQIEGYIFDGATSHSHAVVAARSIGKQVLLTHDNLDIPNTCSTIELSSNSLSSTTLLWNS